MPTTSKKILVIAGSTRAARNSPAVAEWFMKHLPTVKGVEFELVDLKDYPLPFFEEPATPSTATEEYTNPQVKKWSKVIASADGYVFVTPEYNHSYPAVLKNAIDYLFKPWLFKPVAFVSYGASAGGVRAVEHLKQVLLELRMIPLHEEINIVNVWEHYDETSG
jgi:NAD(P)H-dependent FMN reductase